MLYPTSLEGFKVAGELTVITGPMGSGKTLELIKLLSTYERAGYQVHVFKHQIDVRDEGGECKSRAGLSVQAKVITEPAEIDGCLLRGLQTRVMAFEEGQFFSKELVGFIRTVLYETNNRVLVTGLNQNFRGEPFGIMPTLMAMADDLRLLTAICSVCHGPATHTQRLVGGKPVMGDSPEILIAGDDEYCARCPQCFVPPY